MGTVEQRLTVQANDEVFQATKEKAIKEVEEEKRIRNSIFFYYLNSSYLVKYIIL